MNRSKAKNNSEQTGPDESPHKPSNSPANASASGADDTRGVYAETPLASANQSEDGATNKQPGIAYASLEFHKEPTYLEPDEKWAHTAQAKVGPLDDIYANADAKSHAITSSGNASSSHPVKVAPLGDLYAVPVRNSKSPTANPPAGNL